MLLFEKYICFLCRLTKYPSCSVFRLSVFPIIKFCFSAAVSIHNMLSSNFMFSQIIIPPFIVAIELRELAHAWWCRFHRRLFCGTCELYVSEKSPWENSLRKVFHVLFFIFSLGGRKWFNFKISNVFHILSSTFEAAHWVAISLLMNFQRVTKNLIRSIFFVLK